MDVLLIENKEFKVLKFTSKVVNIPHDGSRKSPKHVE